MVEVATLIQDGATTFLKQEYCWTSVFVLVFAVFMALLVEEKFGQLYTTGPFLLGAITSIVSGYIGMQIAVQANIRTAKMATMSLNDAFNVAFRGGMVLGFVLVGLALLTLHLLIMYYQANMTKWFPNTHNSWYQQNSYIHMFEAITGYGLGGSTVALFGRVGGGIYTKAADVGADLVGKVVEDLDEDDIKNPGVIADNVGDNVGDIAGMGSDLFGSFAEATCACLVISTTSPELCASKALYYPLVISAFGILVGIITSFLSTNVLSVDEASQVERSLKTQLIVSTLLMTPLLYFAAVWCLPAHFSFPGVEEGKNVKSWYAFICTCIGLWSGLGIGLFTEYFTSTNFAPV